MPKKQKISANRINSEKEFVLSVEELAKSHATWTLKLTEYK